MFLLLTVMIFIDDYDRFFYFESFRVFEEKNALYDLCSSSYLIEYIRENEGKKEYDTQTNENKYNIR